MATTTKYVVLNENTLGYIQDEQPNMMGVLASNVTRGGHLPINGPVAISPSANLRAATAKDFDTYRVVVPPDFR